MNGPRIARPLPECQLCETPTKRATWEALAGLCSPCHAQLLHPAGGLTIAPDQLPHPVQLDLDA